MDNSPETRRRRQGGARDRHAARMRRRSSTMAVRATGREESYPSRAPRFNTQWLQSDLWVRFRARGGLLLRDVWWYVRHNPYILRGAALVAVMVGVLFLASYFFSGKIYPGISAMGISLSGMSVDEATDALQRVWDDDMQINLVIGRERVHQVRPATLGLSLDARATARAARGAGLSGIPLGKEILPHVSLDYLMAQNYLLDLSVQVDIQPQNASYEWRAGEVVGVRGSEGRMLDVTLTLERLLRDTAGIVQARRLDLLMNPLQADVTDPAPYLDQVRQLASRTLQLNGYDPFTNQQFTWQISPEIFVTWLEAGRISLMLRENTFLPYVDALNASLNETGTDVRYLAPDETMQHLNDAIASQADTITLRVRYRPTVYTVQRGDTGFAISRRTGIPFYLIREANSGINLDSLFPGDQLNIPTRDVTMPHDPVPHKRIVVNLNRQYLTAYENGQVVFEWSISSGVRDAPTSPGIYQILSHEPVATGSSNTLCNAAGLQCGTWRMNWFMGIYEVQPGLVNGFHGGVLLPNGNYLGGGQVGVPYTFGCVMSRDEEARLLYEWAEVGTIVEIISNEFLPMSDLGQLMSN